MFTRRQIFTGTIIVSASAFLFMYSFGYLHTGNSRSIIATTAAEQNSGTDLENSESQSQTQELFNENSETNLHNDPATESTPVDQQDSTLVARTDQAEDQNVAARGGEQRILPRKLPSGELLLEKGVTCDEVLKLQENLRKMGYLNTEPTGYFGELTFSAVITFQKNNSITADGQAGPQTVAKIEEAVKNNQYAVVSKPTPAPTPAPAPTSPQKGNVQLLPWFSQVVNIFSIGTVATVIDVDTGLTFKVKRTYGYNHADVETLTYADTQMLKKIAGGSWNWTRRAAIVEVNGYRIAASFTAMPHAGRDDKPANEYVDGRSGGYGYGANLDAVKGNGMDGQFDIHFLGSKTHSTNSIDAAHQQAIQKAYSSGK